MEKIIESLSEGAIWGVAFTTVMVVSRPLMKTVRPATRAAVKGGAKTTAWLSDKAREGRNSLAELYQEAIGEDDAAPAGGRRGGRAARETQE